MLMAMISELGPWSWWILGLLLLAVEILLPGFFLIWIGMAAIVVGAISFALWDTAVWGWQIQFLVFAVLSLAFAYIGFRVMNRTDGNDSDQPMLNRRTDSLIGRVATLDEPIENGRGRIRLDDTTWVVTGPDLPAGQSVRINNADSGQLHVEPV